MRTILLLAALFIINTTIIAQNFPNPPNIQFVEDLCFSKDIYMSIKIPDDVDLTTLSTADKFKFNTSTYKRRIHKYFNENGFATIDAHYNTSTNFVSKSYSHPLYVQTNETGIHSYCDSNHPYLPNGWTSGVSQDTSQLGGFYDARQNKYVLP